MRLVRRIYISASNPATSGVYFGSKILFPARHDLVLLTNDLPFYNTQMRRLADLIRKEKGSVRMIDIGANIGDGAALVGFHPNDYYWLVEGSATYLPFLEANIEGQKNIKLIKTYLSEKRGLVVGHEVTVNSTARIDFGAEGAIKFETLDNVMAGVDAAAGPNLLKIDVEGHELKIFKGAENTLRNFKPIIFMEWFPRLLRAEGATTNAIFGFLIAMGYRKILAYDHIGLLFGIVDISDFARLREMELYADVRDYYYDLVIVSGDRLDFLEAFYLDERGYFETELEALKKRG